MQSSEIRKRFLAFFEKRGHKVIPSASLVTGDEKGATDTTLFNTAGMQPLIPYLMGTPHPQGARLVDVQKCLRTIDIDEVGDKTHATFFEMLGNWSLGDPASPDGIGQGGYFKEESIKWSYELLTNKEEGFGLDPKRLYVTVFGGNDDVPKDTESFEIWKKYIPEHRIYFLTWNGKKEPNWWDAGENGPCGPDTEMFYDLTKEGLGDLTKEEYLKADEEQKVVEIWNNVFMEYLKKDGKVVGKLSQKNVDTGAGFDRLTAVLQGVDNIYDTDLLKPLMDLMAKANNPTRNKRIIADHLRASVFLIADGVIPSNTDRGYILRRLIRRAIINTTDKKLDEKRISFFVDTLVTIYQSSYPELASKADQIKKVLNDESTKFSEALKEGLKEFEELVRYPHAKLLLEQEAFILFSSFGFPFELTKELAKERGIEIDDLKFSEALKKHQSLSRSGAEKKFKGGLADHNEKTIKLHTAHHLLLAGLQAVVDKNIKQRGSNITEERLRMDFLCDHKLTDEEKKKVEEWVNDKIARGLNVVRREMPLAEAEKMGAEMEFGAKYPDVVSLYFIEDEKGQAISKEFCGGPHVENTKVLGKFKIQKEEAVSQGVRRIKAVLG